AEKVKVSLIDFLGRKVYNNEFLEKIIKVNLENIVSGPYILKIEKQDNNSLFLLFKLQKD
ncbi:MAG: T9SS type A sorting domain-containing protein, partial [Candidatus Kapaibacteriota bacterium]